MVLMAITYDLLQRIILCGKWYYCNGTIMVAITYDLSQRIKLRGKWCTCHGMVVVASVSIATLSIIACTISFYEDRHGKCLYCHDYERCDKVLLRCLATDRYGCKKPQQLQRQTINGCNTLLQRDFLQPLAMNAIWLQYLPFATKLGLLQCFFVVAQRSKVSRAWVYL